MFDLKEKRFKVLHKRWGSAEHKVMHKNEIK